MQFLKVKSLKGSRAIEVKRLHSPMLNSNLIFHNSMHFMLPHTSCVKSILSLRYLFYFYKKLFLKQFLFTISDFFSGSDAYTHLASI